MATYKKYRPIIIALFQSFLAGKIEKRELISTLIKVDKEIRKSPKTLKGLWFKFFADDTLCTTITDLSNDVNGRRDSFIRERMQIVIDNPKNLQIFYS